ncbi:MAG TPA: type II secretion system F family protein, partial [Terriglobales bacterium]
MTPLYLLSVQLSIFFATALLSVWFMTRTTPAVKRLYGVTRLVPESRHRPTQSSQRIRETAFRILHGAISRMGMTMGDKLQMRFRSAGLRTQNCVDGYFAVRLLGPVAVLLFWTFFRDIGFFPIALMAAGAYLGPDLWLTARAKRRRGQIRLGLADALDLMVVCVDAGLGLDQALLRTGQELATSHPVIAEEFMLINLEQRAGKPRINAWRDMADRTQLETVRGFATMLAQSDRFGTPIARALGTFADELR